MSRRSIVEPVRYLSNRSPVAGNARARNQPRGHDQQSFIAELPLEGDAAFREVPVTVSGT